VKEVTNSGLKEINFENISIGTYSEKGDVLNVPSGRKNTHIDMAIF